MHKGSRERRKEANQHPRRAGHRGQLNMLAVEGQASGNPDHTEWADLTYPVKGFSYFFFNLKDFNRGSICATYEVFKVS